MNSIQASERIIEAFGDWLDTQIHDRGWEAYYVNLMFKPLNGPRAAIDSQMHDAIVNCFYPRLCKRIERHPSRPGRHDSLPRLVLFPDLPVFKGRSSSFSGSSLNGGLHYNGILLISPLRRYRENLLGHIRARHSHYAGEKIERIHITPFVVDSLRVMDYASKSVSRCYGGDGDRVDYDRAIFLPKSISEMRKPPHVDGKIKALKDIQSATNVSDELAMEMALRKCPD